MKGRLQATGEEETSFDARRRRIRLRRLDRDDGVEIWTFLWQERSDAGIESHQFSPFMNRQAQEIRIRYLLMTNEPGLATGNGVKQSNVIRPELMSRMCDVGFQQHKRVCRGQCIRRERG